ncbi:MAG: PIN domain-containing protein [Bryobacteraceae bacterium]
MAGFTAFYDANVLYPAELRNLLMHLALTGLFRAKWSADVHEEWISSLLQHRSDVTRDKLERTRVLMDTHAINTLVTGYQHLIPGLHLPDPNDRHVVAAAIMGRADVIVTMNLRDFPADTVGSFGIKAQHPDEFVLHLLHLAPHAVVEAAQNHRESLKNPPKTLVEYLETLARQGLLQTVAVLRVHMQPLTLFPLLQRFPPTTQLPKPATPPLYFNRADADACPTGWNSRGAKSCKLQRHVLLSFKLRVRAWIRSVSVGPVWSCATAPPRSHGATRKSPGREIGH